MVEYDYTYNDLNTLEAEELSSLTKMKEIDLDFNSLTNRVISYFFCIYTYKLVDTGDLVGAGNQRYEWVLTGSSCRTVLGYEEQGDDYYSNATNNTGTGATTFIGGGNIATSPTMSVYEEEDLFKFDILKNELGLNVSEDDCLKRHYASAMAMFDFYMGNNKSEAAKAFSKEAVTVICNDGEVDFDERIINGLTGKAKCIYDNLKSSSTGFKNMIKKFDGDFPVAHLKFEIDPTMSSNTKKAFTRAPENYVIDIVLNGNSTKDASYQKRPNLLVAKTIIHEVIHAEMFRKLLSLANNNGNIDVASLNQMLQQGDYPGMLDYYVRYGNNINSNWQHQQMAAHYRETIARMLQEFDTGNAVPQNQTPQQLYLDLAWEGLIYSNITAWQEIMNDTERARIANVISNYINNNLNQTCAE